MLLAQRMFWMSISKLFKPNPPMQATFSTDQKSTNTTTRRRDSHRQMQADFMWHLFQQGFKAKEIADVYKIQTNRVYKVFSERSLYTPVRRLEKARYYRERTKIMRECLLRGFNVKQIADYFQFDVVQVYKFVRVKELKKLLKYTLP